MSKVILSSTRVLLVSTGIAFAGSVLSAETLEEKKARLQQELQVLETQEREAQEILILEEKIQQLKAKQAATATQVAPVAPAPVVAPQVAPVVAPTPVAPVVAPAPQAIAPQAVVTPVIANEENGDDISQEIVKSYKESKYQEPPYLDPKRNRNGLLIGFNVGSLGDSVAQFSSGNNAVRADFLMFGGKVGFQFFIGSAAKSPLGLRLYGDFLYGYNRSVTVGKASTYLATGNADLLLEFNIPKTYSYVGVFGGVGYGRFHYEHDINATSSTGADKLRMDNNILVYNVGAAITLGAKHRLEFSYKFLPDEIKKDSLKRTVKDYMGFSYQYTF